MSLNPAWPVFAFTAQAPVHINWHHCSLDNRVRVASIDGKFFVSIDGDNFAGSFKDETSAREYGERAINPRSNP